MGEPLIEALRFVGRYGAESEQDAAARRIRERNEAASRIADLEAKLATAVRALEPFAALGRAVDLTGFGAAIFPDDCTVPGTTWSENGEEHSLTWGAFRQARTVADRIEGEG